MIRRRVENIHFIKLSNPLLVYFVQNIEIQKKCEKMRKKACKIKKFMLQCYRLFCIIGWNMLLRYFFNDVNIR